MLAGRGIIAPLQVDMPQCQGCIALPLYILFGAVEGVRRFVGILRSIQVRELAFHVP